MIKSVRLLFLFLARIPPRDGKGFVAYHIISYHIVLPQRNPHALVVQLEVGVQYHGGRDGGMMGGYANNGRM